MQTPSSSLLDAFSVVLVQPQNPINVGTVMRAMKNMGLSRLSLVDAPAMDWDKTQISAHRTQEMLETTKHFASMEQAIAGSHIAYGFTARERSQTWQSLDLELAATQMLELARAGHNICLVFGREQSGLSNEELEHCAVKVCIPTSEYSSLNLAQAVLLASYELARGVRLGAQKVESTTVDIQSGTHQYATLQDRERLQGACKAALEQIGYFKSLAPNSVLHKFRQIMNRVDLSREEVDLLLGMFREIDNYARLLRRGIVPKLLG